MKIPEYSFVLYISSRFRVNKLASLECFNACQTELIRCNKSNNRNAYINIQLDEFYQAGYLSYISTFTLVRMKTLKSLSKTKLFRAENDFGALLWKSFKSKLKLFETRRLTDI